MESERYLTIREIIMADLEDLPQKAKIAREVIGINFPEPFVDQLIKIRQNDDDRKACINSQCLFTASTIEWRSYFNGSTYNCPKCREKSTYLNVGKRHPLFILGKLHQVAEECKWYEGVTAIERSVDAFQSADLRLQQITEKLSKDL